MNKKRFLKPTKKKFIHQQQARTLRLKHLKQRKRNCLPAMRYNLWCKIYKIKKWCCFIQHHFLHLSIENVT